MATWRERVRQEVLAILHEGFRSDSDADLAARIADALPSPDERNGYTIVPITPTPEMIEAASQTEGIKAVNSMMHIAHMHGADLPIGCVDYPPLNQAWDAMVAAAVAQVATK